MTSKDDSNRPDAGFESDFTLPAQQRLACNHHELLGLSQPARSTGGQDRNQQRVTHFQEFCVSRDRGLGWESDVGVRSFNCAMISAVIETAIPIAVRSPRFKPIGLAHVSR